MQLFRRFSVAVGAGLAAALVLATVAPAPATAMRAPTADRPHVTTDHVMAAAGWLATQFVDGTHLPHPDGNRFGNAYGSTWYPDYGLNADVIFGLAAAKSAAAKMHAALAYLARHVHAYTLIAKRHPHHRAYDGSVGKLALAVLVAGARPRHFAGYNLLRVLRRDECVRSSTSGEPCPAPGAAANIYSSVSESFVLLAEARGNGGPSPAARRYFRSLQCASGGFTSGVTKCGTGRADIDATSYALMALQAIGGRPAAIRRAAHWLRSKERPAGYWVSQGHPNVDSTGLAAAALAGLHRHVRAARAWLRSQQVGAGHRGAGAFRYAGQLVPTTTSATSPSVIATAQALTGLAPQGTLAELTSAGAISGAPVFRPRATGTSHVTRGARAGIRGIGFAAGERVRLTLRDGTFLSRATAGPLGVVRIHYRVPASAGQGAHTLVLHGVASKLTARHRIRVGAAAAAPVAYTAFTTPIPTHVAILIRGKGARCVKWHRGVTGDQILNEVATVVYRPSDGLIVQIDGTPKSATADDTHYWSYWHDVNGQWRYSSTGASGYQPAAGTVEGWAYDNGTARPPKPNAHPAGLYQAICGSQDQSAAPSSAAPTPAPLAAAHHPRPSAAHPSPPSRTATRHAAHPRKPRHAHPTPRVRHHHSTAAHSAPAAAATPSTPPAQTPRPRLLAKPAAQLTRGSAVPTIVALGVVIVLLGGGFVLAARRRRTG